MRRHASLTLERGPTAARNVLLRASTFIGEATDQMKPRSSYFLDHHAQHHAPMKEIVSLPLQPTDLFLAVVLEKAELLKIKGGCSADDKGDKRRRKTGG